MIGKRLAHYEILEKIGQGGMGEVYRARDAKLLRDTAIKLLPQAFTQDPERLARFEREAQVLASLNHSGIAAIHGLEESEGYRFLVMEMVEGEDLAQRLSQGPISVDRVVPLALQIAEALEAAHARGIVHRDLKPANIKLTPGGKIKILDFGLAKALEGDRLPESSASLAESPTISAHLTGADVILGTAAYMSPEQARGTAVDARTDIWAFGVVCFEMLTGRQLFRGETVSDTLAAVLREPIEWGRLPQRTPLSVRRMLRRCMERDPSRRLHSIADARLELQEAGKEEQTRTGPPQPARRSRAVHILWGTALAIAVLVAVFAVARLRQVPRPVVSRFTLALEDVEVGSLTPPVVSPDGSRVAYVAGSQLWIRSLDQLEPIAVPNSKGAHYPFWSPDGEFVGFVSGSKMWKAPSRGGSPVMICDATFGSAARACWREDGQIVYSTGSSGLMAVSAQGGRPQTLLEITTGTDVDFHEPFVLPESKGILFVVHPVVGSIGRLDVFAGAERRMVWAEEEGGSISAPVYDPSGHILLQRDEPNPGIWALPFSLDKLEVIGDPFLVVGWGDVPTVGSNGTLVYSHGSLTRHQLVWVDLEGKILGEIGEVWEHIDDAALSPEGDRLVAQITDSQGEGVSILDLGRGTRIRLPHKAAANPFWLPDGKRVGYLRPDSSSIVLYRADGGGNEKTLLRTGSEGIPQNFASTPHASPDGKFVVYILRTLNRKEDLWVASLDGSTPPRSLVSTPARELAPQFSPDGRYLAYSSNESGRQEVYLREFLPDGSLGAGRWQVSSDGGGDPRWSRSGDRLFYDDENTLMEVQVTTGETVQLGKPRELFSASAAGLEFLHGYDVGMNDDRIVTVRLGQPDQAEEKIVVVQNWYEEFRRK